MSFVDNAIDLPWRNFFRPEFGTKFPREVLLLLEILEFPYNTVWDRWKEASTQNPARFVQLFRYNIGLCQTDGRTDRHTTTTSL